MLSQSSDWSFILRAGTTTELAKNRIDRHLNRFWFLMNEIENNKEVNSMEYEKINKEDSLFPLIQPKDWSRIESN